MVLSGLFRKLNDMLAIKRHFNWKKSQLGTSERTHETPQSQVRWCFDLEVKNRGQQAVQARMTDGRSGPPDASSPGYVHTHSMPGVLAEPPTSEGYLSLGWSSRPKFQNGCLWLWPANLADWASCTSSVKRLILGIELISKWVSFFNSQTIKLTPFLAKHQKCHPGLPWVVQW